MTAAERRNHSLINGSRRKRIARGSGTSVEEVNRLLKQFVEMRKMLKTMSGIGGGPQRAAAADGHAEGTNVRVGSVEYWIVEDWSAWMLAIRMRRAGSKNRPFFRIVVTESQVGA